ncbi:MAG TPA: flagellar basal body-associated FliL family protein [Edaphobacter sp.]|nr:flagellar basal body-associated FliL family protein [Edaphobacter sp.]
MATSPTVLAGVSTSSSPAPAPAPLAAPVAAKFPIAPLLIAVVVGVVIATLVVGGVVYYLAHTGRLPMQGGATQRSEAVAPAATRAMVLEPLLVNLADAGGSSYLRVALTLRVADVIDKKGAKASDEKSKNDKGAEDAVAAVRDTVLAVLGRQTADGLLAADGKEHLKTELKAALAEHNADLKVKDVFFTDFLVQR